MLPAGGRKLGGSSLGYEKFYTPSQMAAIAAERRMKDEKWCANAHDRNSENGFGAIDDDDVVILNDKGKEKFNQEVYVISSDEDEEEYTKKKQVSRTSEQKWECIVCTVINEPLILMCTCCNAIRHNNGLVDEYEEIFKPKAPVDRQQVKTPQDDKWRCPDCTTGNSAQWRVCSGCQHIRYF